MHGPAMLNSFGITVDGRAVTGPESDNESRAGKAGNFGRFGWGDSPPLIPLDASGQAELRREVVGRLEQTGKGTLGQTKGGFHGERIAAGCVFSKQQAERHGGKPRARRRVGQERNDVLRRGAWYGHWNRPPDPCKTEKAQAAQDILRLCAFCVFSRLFSSCDAGWVADFDFEISRLLEIGRYAHRADEVVITFGIKRAEGL